MDLGAEGLGVALQDGLDGRLPDGLLSVVVAAVQAVARLAVPPAGEALAIPTTGERHNPTGMWSPTGMRRKRDEKTTTMLS